MSVVDVHTAIAGPVTCHKALQGGPNGHICEFVLIDVPHGCHGKAEAAVGEPRVPTQCVCQGEGSILQSEPRARSPRKVCRATIPGHPEAILPPWFPLSSRSLRLRKDEGPEPEVKRGLPVLEFRTWSLPQVQDLPSLFSPIAILAIERPRVQLSHTQHH